MFKNYESIIKDELQYEIEIISKYVKKKKKLSKIKGLKLVIYTLDDLYIPFLKKIIKTPKQYLNSNIFNKYTKITKNDIIINKYSL